MFYLFLGLCGLMFVVTGISYSRDWKGTLWFLLSALVFSIAAVLNLH